MESETRGRPRGVAGTLGTEERLRRLWAGTVATSSPSPWAHRIPVPDWEGTPVVLRRRPRQHIMPAIWQLVPWTEGWLDPWEGAGRQD